MGAEGQDLERHALVLDQAMRSGVPIQRPGVEQRLTLEQAYRVQDRLTAMRRSRGETIVGLKLAFTNRKTMARVGVRDPVSCCLCSGMQLADGGSIAMAGHVRLRAEPELAFRLARAISHDATAEQALACVAAIAPAIEIVDARYTDTNFWLPDVVADYASGCAFVTGPWQAPDLDFGHLAVTLSVDGQTVASGSTANILDHPIHALLAAARLAHENHQPLGAGAIVMAGSATDPFVLGAGQHVVARIEALGSVAFSVTQA